MRTRWPARVVFVLVIAYLLIAIPVGLRNTYLRLRVAAKTAGAPLAEVRAHAFGRRYAATIDAIRQAIPENEPYLLSELDEPGSLLWVRFDLLPRRAIVPRAGGSPGSDFDCWRDQVRFEVVAVGSGRPPLFREHPVAPPPPGCPPAPWRGAQR